MSRHAFLIGSDGPEKFKNLKKLSHGWSDVKRFSEALAVERTNFTLCLSNDQNPFTVIKKFEQIAADLKEGDTQLFYFAGHGYYYRGELYLLLDKSDPHKLYSTSLPLSAIQTVFRNSNPNLCRIMILDCCRSGQAVRSPFDRGVQDTEVIERAAEGSASIVLAACGSSGVAREKPGEGGIITSLIIEALTTRFYEADGLNGSPDGYLSMEDLINWLVKRVKERSKEFPDGLEKPILCGTASSSVFLSIKRDFGSSGERIKKSLESMTELYRRSSDEKKVIPINDLINQARPARNAARQLPGDALIESLLDLVGDKDGRSAKLFLASIIIRERLALQYFDRLAIILQDSNFRGSAIWRGLRAIQELLPYIEIDEMRRKMLIKTFSVCVKKDSKPGERFSRPTVVKKLWELSSRKKLNFKKDLIFSAEQMKEYDDWVKKGKPKLDY